MNEDDDYSADDGRAPAAQEPDATLEALLAAQGARVLALLEEARTAAAEAGPGSSPQLLARYRAPVRAAMNAFGDALADLLSVEPHVLDSSSVASGPLGPLLRQAANLPMFRRAQQTIANHAPDRDLQRILTSGRGAGFDLPSLLLDDYFQDSVFVRTFRARVAAVGETLRDEICRRVEGGQESVHLLNLRCGGLLELQPTLERRSCASRVAITFVDQDTSALRLARQDVESRLTIRPTFIRAHPLTVGEGLNRPRERFDVVLTFSLFDLLPDSEVLRLLRNSHAFLKPGGVFITSGYLPSVPRGEKALALGLLGAHVNFWDEDGWRTLLRNAGLNPEPARFQRRQPAALAVIAGRDD